jgi:DNA-binding CsgD family transcriptional regulator
METQIVNQPYGKKEFTPTEERMLAVLSDGDRHKKEELKACLADELAESPQIVNFHICNIRKKLQTKGQSIICEKGWGRQLYYRQVRLLANPYKE